MYQDYKIYLAKQYATSAYRKLTYLDKSIKKEYIDFSTNDYLGLSKSIELLAAANLAGKKYGVGATGSRLLSGNNTLFEEFEKEIAQCKNTESALIFNSGFQANLTVLATILDPKILTQKPLIFFDRSNHSSLYQAIFLSGAKIIRYQHNDLDDLAKLLDQYKDNTQPKFIVTETVFGMDGDILPIENMKFLAKKYKTFLYLDEAHATGLLGKNGYGLSTLVNLTDIPHIIMGTFSKALGCSGAYIACSELIKEYLINRSPGFIYSTANSPIVIGAAFDAWKMVKDFSAQRKKLFLLSDYLRLELKKIGFNTNKSASNIIPIILGDKRLAIKMTKDLLDNNIIVSCIRPPTIPPNTSRLRIALNIDHSKKDIDSLINVLKNI